MFSPIMLLFSSPWSLVTSLYSHDIILFLFYCIIKQDYKNKYLVTGDWSQSIQSSVAFYNKLGAVEFHLEIQWTLIISNFKGPKFSVGHNGSLR